MRWEAHAVAFALGSLLMGSAPLASDGTPATVLDHEGRTVRVHGDEGVADAPPGPRAWVDPTLGPGPRPCTPADDGEAIEWRESRGDGFLVDACGQVIPEPGRAAQPPVAGSPRRAPNPTIDRMTTGTSYANTYTPAGSIALLGSAKTYYLSDGSQWTSGAGTYSVFGMRLDRVELVGNVVRYVMLPPAEGLVYRQTDYDSGDNRSSQGSLGTFGPLVLEATLGSRQAVVRAQAVILSNDPTWYGEAGFHYFTSVVGSVVPFTLTYTLVGGTWAADTFNHAFQYSNAGEVDFAHPVSVPRVESLSIQGPSQVPPSSSVQFRSIVLYENGVTRVVTDSSTWEVAPASFATIQHGLLVTGSLTAGQQIVTMRATYVEGRATVSADKTVVCCLELDEASHWPMYQADPRHTGYRPLALDTDRFSLRWQRDIGGTFALNPVAGGDGKVFVTLDIYFNNVPTLFALDAVDGTTLWSKSFGSIYSVNPPSYSSGTVYVQTGNHSTDTWLRAFDAETGGVVFKVPHDAQWEDYYSPTIFAGSVYVNGGHYGGMYSFDAYSGTRRWYSSLPQYDQWTPAVDAEHAYAYLGEYSPALYVVNRASGALEYAIPDPEFDWNGWSMRLAPVLGDQDNVIVIHDGRLISFDLPGRRIGWQLARTFTGQPSLADGRIYAIDGGGLVVIDEQTRATLWSWRPPAGSLTGAMIVTDTHVLVSTGSNVYAVDLATRQATWSYPVGGSLALADGVLYVASADGTLSAFNTGEYVPSPLLRLEVSGPAQVVEGTSAAYRALAHYADGRVRDRTLVSQWSVAPATSASVGADGVLTVSELLQPAQDVVVRAVYSEHDQTVEGAVPVRLVIGVSIPEFVARNLARAVEAKREALEGLNGALVREKAALDVLVAAGADARADLVRRAVAQELRAGALVQQSIRILQLAADPTAVPASADRREATAEIDRH